MEAEPRALIVYYSKTGHTRRASQDIAEGLEREGLTVDSVSAAEFRAEDAKPAAIVAVGSPCHAGSVRIGGGLSHAVRSALAKLEPGCLKGKVAGAFSIHCSFGGGTTVRTIETRLEEAGARIPVAGVVVRAGAPLSLFTGPTASDEARDRLRRFGRQLALAARDGADVE